MRRKDLVRFIIGYLVVLIIGIFRMELSATPHEIELSMQEVSFSTSDDMTIFGSWITPNKASTRLPGVILLHDYGTNRRDWGIFIPDLVRRGYNVLALDLRGHGQSKEHGASVAPSVEYLMQVGHLDIQAALKWMKSQKNTDMKKIALIGVGLGADIAYLCSSAFKKQIHATVVISPSYAAINEGQFADLNPRAILFCVSTKGQQGQSMLAADTLSNFTSDPKKIVRYNSSAYGLTMFYKHPEIKQEIFDWLSH